MSATFSAVEGHSSALIVAACNRRCVADSQVSRLQGMSPRRKLTGMRTTCQANCAEDATMTGDAGPTHSQPGREAAEHSLSHASRACRPSMLRLTTAQMEKMHCQ